MSPVHTTHLSEDLIAELGLDVGSGRATHDEGAAHPHLAGCEACRRRLLEATETFAALELTSAAPAPTSPTLRQSLLAASDPATPHGRHLSRLARLFDLDFARLSAVVETLKDPSRWESTLLPTVALFHFEGGAAYATADTGFVRFSAGSAFPGHRHVGEETTLVLSGRLILEDGHIVLPGEHLVMPDGTAHSFRVGDDEDCLCALRLLGHIEID